MYLVPVRNKIDEYQNQETLKTANAAKAKRVIALQNGQEGFRREKADKVLLIDYLDKRIAYYRDRGAQSTAQGIANVKTYCRRYKGDGMLLSGVTKDYLQGFIKYLNGTGLGKGTIHTYYNYLAIALNSAVREGQLKENPSGRLDPHTKPGVKESRRDFLTIDEVRLLIDTPCESAILKQAFLFACFTGLRISDVSTLRREDVVDTGKGWQIQKHQQKTGETVYIPLSENALRWLPQGKGAALVFPALPPTSTLNRYLRRWTREAGITKHVTFHVSRHTFATLALTYGADIFTVSKLLGHTNVSTTQIYAKVVDENKRKAVNLIPAI